MYNRVMHSYSRFKKFGLFLFFAVFLFSACTAPSSDSITFEAMNTVMSVKSNGKNAAKANQKVRERLIQIENLLSVTDENSEIFKINHQSENLKTSGNENQVYFVSKETAFLFDFSLKMAQKTDGALNPCLYAITSDWGFTTGNYRIPSDDEISQNLKFTDYKKASAFTENNSIELPAGTQVDFGAVAKGFAGDEAIKILAENGINSAVLDLGGNIQLLGEKNSKNGEKSLWKIGLKSPFGGEPVIALELKDCAVITSGGYERFFTADDGQNYIHIFDGKTGRPVKNDLASVTIIAPSGLYADSLSTAIFVMGKDTAVNFWRQNSDFEMILITNSNQLFYTSGLRSAISVLEEFSEISVIEKS